MLAGGPLVGRGSLWALAWLRLPGAHLATVRRPSEVHFINVAQPRGLPCAPAACRAPAAAMGDPHEVIMGTRVRVWWPDMNEFYAGTCCGFDETKGKWSIIYDDGDAEQVDLMKEQWEITAQAEQLLSVDDLPLPGEEREHAGKGAKRAREQPSASAAATVAAAATAGRAGKSGGVAVAERENKRRRDGDGGAVAGVPPKPKKPTPASVRAWLESLDMAQYADSFEEHKVEVGQLTQLSYEDLKEVGVGLVGDRHRVWEALLDLAA